MQFWLKGCFIIIFICFFYFETAQGFAKRVTIPVIGITEEKNSVSNGDLLMRGKGSYDT